MRYVNFGSSTGTVCFGMNRSGMEPEWSGINCIGFCDWKIQPVSTTGRSWTLCI